MPAGRRAARRLAFQTLFEAESRRERSLTDVLADRVEAIREEEGRHLDRRAIAFARKLVEGTLAERDHVDGRIRQIAPAFPLETMAVTDRVALELGLFELLCSRSASVSVVINEAVELAKTYGGDSSARFVNGVMGTAAAAIEDATKPTC